MHHRFSRKHLGDDALFAHLDRLDHRDRGTTADLIATLAEVDERQLYRPKSYSSMEKYCVEGRGYSEDVAHKRIRAARAARRFPVILEALDDGRLHLCGVAVLASRLTPENADELLAAAAHKTRAEIERLIASRFPKPNVPDRLEVESPSTRTLADSVAPGPPGASGDEVAPGPLAGRPGRMTPLGMDRVALQCTVPGRVKEKIRYARSLASHQLPSGDLATMLELALDAWIEKLERKKFAATSRARRGSRRGIDPRYIPAPIKRAVWERDRGQCTFVSDEGRRCSECRFLEYDHVDPVARGGAVSVETIRLLCRAHNQYAAEQTFGVDFMNHKRRMAKERAAAAANEKARATAKERAGAAHAPTASQQVYRHAEGRQVVAEKANGKAWTEVAPGPPGSETRNGSRRNGNGLSTDPSNDRDVTPWLLKLGVRAADARRMAELCETIPEASLEERIKLALSCLAPPHH